MYKRQLLFIICILLCCSGLAIAAEPTETPEGQVALVWDANTESDLEGYRVHYGESTGNYDTMIDVGNVTNYMVKKLIVGKSYYFALTAYDTSKNESGYSLEVFTDSKDKTGPSFPANLHEIIEEITIKAKTVNIITGS